MSWVLATRVGTELKTHIKTRNPVYPVYPCGNSQAATGITAVPDSRVNNRIEFTHRRLAGLSSGQEIGVIATTPLIPSIL